tara:strand:+ start:69 stop:542 length:474 start_codon:yes stop_codon:yes gene_type:complete
MNEKRWITGSGTEIEFKDILDEIEKYISKGGKIFIGSDSQLCNNTCIFATAICLHGAQGSQGGRYFFKRFKDEGPQYSNLKLRIISEVTHSLDVAIDLMGKFPDSDIEVHVDIGRGPKSKTSIYVDHIQGWARATGLSCKVKPDAWASASVADKHTK